MKHARRDCDRREAALRRLAAYWAENDAAEEAAAVRAGVGRPRNGGGADGGATDDDEWGGADPDPDELAPIARGPAWEVRHLHAPPLRNRRDGITRQPSRASYPTQNSLGRRSRAPRLDGQFARGAVDGSWVETMKERIRLLLNKTAVEKGLMSGGGEGRFIDANSGYMCASRSVIPSRDDAHATRPPAARRDIDSRPLCSARRRADACFPRRSPRR